MPQHPLGTQEKILGQIENNKNITWGINYKDEIFNKKNPHISSLVKSLQYFFLHMVSMSDKINRWSKKREEIR